MRVYRLNVSAYPKPVKAKLELTCPAREFIVQEIPIVNNSERDWLIKITLNNKDDGMFTVTT